MKDFVEGRNWKWKSLISGTEGMIIHYSWRELFSITIHFNDLQMNRRLKLC